MKRKYLVIENKTIGIYDDIKEAETEIDNLEMWYPQNNYELEEVQE